jgi:hypothetical protein
MKNYSPKSQAYKIAKVIGYTQTWRLHAGAYKLGGAYTFNLPRVGLSANYLMDLQKKVHKLFNRKVTVTVKSGYRQSYVSICVVKK